MDLFKFMGCSELKFRYMCLSVFLVYSLVNSLFSVIYIVRSRRDGTTEFDCWMYSV